MPTEAVTALDFALALLPILTVLVLMVGFNWSGARAGASGWITALVTALLLFGAEPTLLAYSQARGALLTLSVLYIIWMALVLFNVVREAGAISVIAGSIARLTNDRILQILILGWVFSGFLQSVSGFGVPIAVVAPLLIGLGFSPITAVAAVATGHSWSVTFGDIGTAFNALIVASGVPGETLAPWTAGLLAVACLGCGLAAAYTYEGFASVKRGLPVILIIGAVISATQYALAVSGLWNVAGLTAGLVGLGLSIAFARLTPLQNATGANASSLPASNPSKLPLSHAALPYLVLILIVSVATFVIPVSRMLNGTQIVLRFPLTQTTRGWITQSGPGPPISLFGHAGALLTYASLIGYGWYRLNGHYQPGALRNILSNTFRSAVPSSLGIATMVGLATIMDQSGMTYSLAVGLSNALRPLFGFLAPFIGLLGAFMTGSNTNSNVIFASLQQNIATLLSFPVSVILAAQTTGGSLGSMLAPAKIIVGCSTSGLSGKEGEVLRRTVIYGAVITAAIGVITWIAVTWI